MPRPSSAAQRARSHLGAITARKDATPEQIADARRDLAEANIADWIARQLAAAPPLTGEQIERLRALLPPPAVTANRGQT